MRPGHVEALVEVVREFPDAILVHQGGPSVLLNRVDAEVFIGDPAPGLATVWLPAALAAEMGLLVECEDAA
jgi:hypothetical protein